MNSPCSDYLHSFLCLPDPMTALDEALSKCTTFELASLRYDWPQWWARPKQLPPEFRWSSWGGLTGRGWGKTRAMAEFVNGEVREGRARRIALISQNEDACVNVMINGESGLIATARPDCRAEFEKGRVLWANGAQAFVYTPERPKNCYGPEHDMLWLSEIHGWPRATMKEPFSALTMGLRLGLARMIWDSNPHRKHPLIEQLLDRAKIYPDRHLVFRGTTFENADNLNPEAIEEWEREYGGTMVGREMLLGEQLEEEDGALFKQIWIDRARREMPSKLKRRIIVVDPAISTRKGTDKTGIVELGLGIDDQIYIIQDNTDKLAWEKWGDIVVDNYASGRCDCVIVERNRGGDACLANIRARAEAKDWSAIKVADDAITHYVEGTIYVKEVIGRISKEARAEPVASLVERGRVSMVRGADFTDLEEQLTTYEDAPGAVSPNNYDAFVWGCWELAGLAKNGVQSQSFNGIATAARALQRPQPQSTIASVLRASSVGRRL